MQTKFQGGVRDRFDKATPLRAQQEEACRALARFYGLTVPGTLDESDPARAGMQTLVLHQHLTFEPGGRSRVWERGLYEHGRASATGRYAATPQPPPEALSLRFHEAAAHGGAHPFPPESLAAVLRLVHLKMHELDLCRGTFTAYRDTAALSTALDLGVKEEARDVRLFAEFARVLHEQYGVLPRRAFVFYLAYGALAGRGRRDRLESCLLALEPSMADRPAPPQPKDARGAVPRDALQSLAAYMERSLGKLAVSGDEWHKRFASELAALVHHSRIELPTREHVLVVAMPATPEEAAAYARRHHLREPVSSQEEEEGEEGEETGGTTPQPQQSPAPQQQSEAAGGEEEGEEGEEEETVEEAGAPRASPQSLEKEKEQEGGEGGGEGEGEAEEDESVPETVRAQAKLVGAGLPSMAAIERRHGKHRHRRHHKHDHGFHEGQRGAHHRYVLDMARAANLSLVAPRDVDAVVRLGLLALLARQDDQRAVRLAVARTLFEQPGDMLRRADEAGGTASLLVPSGPSRDPREWVAFLDGLYAHLDGATERPALLEVDRFNDLINSSVLPPEERAYAPSLRLKRYITAYAARNAGERALLWWALSGGAPLRKPETLDAALEAYLTSHPRIPPATLQLLLYLATPAPSSAQ